MKRYLCIFSPIVSLKGVHRLNFSRLIILGKCEVCSEEEAKFTCQKCDVKVCSVKCLITHRNQSKCDALEATTSKEPPVKKLSKKDLEGDYNFIEDCAHYVQQRKVDKIKSITQMRKNLRKRLILLRHAASLRNVTFRHLLPNFTRNKVNTSFYDIKSKLIKWRVEWVFSDAGNMKLVDSSCPENEKLSTLLEKYLSPDSKEVEDPKALKAYHSCGIKNIKVLLKAEGIKRCKNRFFRLDPERSLKENLIGRTVIEFPVIYLLVNDKEEFYVIHSDDEVELEADQHRKSFESEEAAKITSRQDINEAFRRLAIERKRKERRHKSSENDDQVPEFLFENEDVAEVEAGPSRNI